MYLSKVRVTGVGCRNPYELHRVLWGVFPVDGAAKRDFLFRVEKSDGKQAEVLMQSLRCPSLGSKEARVTAIKDYPLLLHEGQRLRFLLVANPVKTIDDEGGRKNAKGEMKKCRVPLVNIDEQRAWIERKLTICASLEFLEMDGKAPLYFRKNRADITGKIQPVVFQGVLTVKDPDALVSLIRRGIGPAKAFGCGLLSLARAS
ncbi:MAG: type I-E CRISPR-associated protein Cas6/Cse3/CasE [Nitrospirota bacterium]